MSRVILCTQAQADAYLAEHVPPTGGIEATFAPIEAINLDQWIAPRECCSGCAEIRFGLRLDDERCIITRCGRCARYGLSITWGEAQFARWKRNEHRDDGPPITRIRVVGGEAPHTSSLARQADRAWIRFEAHFTPRG